MIQTTFLAMSQMFFIKPNMIIFQKPPKTENICIFPCTIRYLWFHSQKKWKDGLEGSLNRVLFVSELELPKILVPRLPQHTSNVNIEYAGKSEYSQQLYYS